MSEDLKKNEETFNRESRRLAVEKIQSLRNGRLLLSFMNFDRRSDPPLPGLQENFRSDVKEPLFRVLKESYSEKQGIDLFLYTRGGDTNAVWPIVNLIREFDPDFQVIVPFRCHSSGTLVALGAQKIIMGPISELSPIDPTVGNAFNPPDPANSQSRLGISVEDVQAFREFLLHQIESKAPDEGEQRQPEDWRKYITPFIDRLVEQVHPLSLGHVYRVLQQIKQLAEKLMTFHQRDGEVLQKKVDALTTQFYSHTHMIDRNEAKEILEDRVEFASQDLAKAMDDLLGQYKKAFRIWKPFFAAEKLGDKPVKNVRFVGGVVETTAWSYLYETNAKIQQFTPPPTGMQVQLPPGQTLPLIPGIKRHYSLEMLSQGWERNEKPKGVTI